jgi:hypothetical protein
MNREPCAGKKMNACRGVLVLVGAFLAIAGCAGRPKVDDLQAVFGPAGIRFDHRALRIDLNSDQRPERVVLLADQRRGLSLPRSEAEWSGAITVDGFAVFDGRHPGVPVFYQYADDGGLDLRIDVIDGHRLLVADGGRDHVQYVWGWWSYPEVWPPTGWEARQRTFDERSRQWGEWKPREKTFVLVGK